MNKDVTNILPDDSEPTVSSGANYLPLWLTCLLAVMVYWGCNYVDKNGGRFSELVYAPYESTNQLASFTGGGDPGLALGKQKYQMLCAPCHQESGLGNAGQAPPLAGSEWVNAPGAGRIIRIAQTGLVGPVTVKGTEWNLAMPAMGATATDEELAAILSYIRSSWGNKAAKVPLEQVKTVRAALAGRTDPHTVPELEKTPDTE
jgi:mono/diheme cytochrome c family protein